MWRDDKVNNMSGSEYLCVGPQVCFVAAVSAVYKLRVVV